MKLQSVLIYIKLSDLGWGSEADEDQIFKMQLELMKLLEGGIDGYCDGNEFGAGYGTIFLYGPDANKLYQRIKPLLKKFYFPKKSFIIKQFDDSTQEKIDPNALLN